MADLKELFDHLTAAGAYLPGSKLLPEPEQKAQASFPFRTTLSPDEESDFHRWVFHNKVPYDASPKADYDMRGFWKGVQTGDPIAMDAINPSDGLRHFPDKWKTPYHKTFSNESMYATPEAPHWEASGEAGFKQVTPSGDTVFLELSRPNKPE